MTLDQIVKVTDDNGAVHGSDGRFARTGGSKASGKDDSKPKALKAPKVVDSAIATPPGIKFGAKWGMISTGGGYAAAGGKPNYLDVRIKTDRWGTGKFRDTASVAAGYQGEGKVAVSLRSGWMPEPKAFGATLARIVEEMRKHYPDEDLKFDFIRPREHEYSRNPNEKEKEIKDGAERDEIIARLFDADGRPNDMFGSPKKPKLAASVTETEVAKSQALSSLPPELREHVVSAVATELKACKLMPQKLALLTDKPVAGLKSPKNSLAWAAPTADGGIVSIRGKADDWKREMERPQMEQGPFTHSVSCALPPGPSRLTSTITHEMGHHLDFQIKAICKNKDHPDHAEVSAAYDELVSDYRTPHS